VPPRPNMGLPVTYERDPPGADHFIYHHARDDVADGADHGVDQRACFERTAAPSIPGMNAICVSPVGVRASKDEITGCLWPILETAGGKERSSSGMTVKLAATPWRINRTNPHPALKPAVDRVDHALTYKPERSEARNAIRSPISRALRGGGRAAGPFLKLGVAALVAELVFLRGS